VTGDFEDEDENEDEDEDECLPTDLNHTPPLLVVLIVVRLKR
jgi:hypothetical protein